MQERDVIEAGVTGLARAFGAGLTTPVEALECYAARIGVHNSHMNAFLDLRLQAAADEAEESAARWAAGQPLSPIDGVPIGVKANIAVAGLPCHAGIAAYSDNIAEADAAVVSRLKRAGAIILGTLNMHEGALGATTDNQAFGRTENPRRTGYTPGGSSGGSAAAVAGGLVAGALGTDTMGSVRIPSAYCGCAGHKPTPGLVSTEGVVELSRSLDHVGPHARRVEDLEAMMTAMAGQPLQPARTELDAARIGVWSWEASIDVEPVVADSFERALQRLKREKLSLKPVTPPDYAYGKDRRAGLLISEREADRVHAERLRTDKDGFSETFRKLMTWGADRPEAEYRSALERLSDLRRAAKALFDDVDFVVAPVAPQTAFPFGVEAPANQADFTAWANFAGLPATAIPTGCTDQGLPLSMQIIAGAGKDLDCLAMARRLERVFGSLGVANPAI